MLLGLLLTLNIIVCVALVAVVLLQRSEGGALGMGGGPSGFMTTRGAGNLLTQLTWGLGSAFFILCLALTLVTGRERGDSSVVDRVKVDSIDPGKLGQTQAPPATAPAQPQAPLPQAPAPQVNNPFLGEPAEPAPQAPSR